MVLAYGGSLTTFWRKRSLSGPQNYECLRAGDTRTSNQSVLMSTATSQSLVIIVYHRVFVGVPAFAEAVRVVP
jgi:hypothetical protein